MIAHSHFLLCRLNIPANLVVGTLDSLISLSDELSRMDTAVENVVRKVVVF